MNTHSFGIDLGTSNIKIYNRLDDKIFVEKNMIAIMNKKQVFAYGDSAFEMYEKAPGNIKISYPLSNGVIADIQNMKILIKYFMNGLMKSNVKPGDFFIAVPTDITEVEKRAFYDLIKESEVKARRIMVVEKALANGLGMDIDVKNAQGVLIVDVGYNTTDISIVSLGGIVISKMIKCGGLTFDETIKNVIRNELCLYIGGKSAENVKMMLRDIETQHADAVVYGRDIVTGLPVERIIPTKSIDIALLDNFHTIVDNIKIVLERTPPELSADIYRNGIYLTGGGSLVNNLSKTIEKETGLKVNHAEDPLLSVAEGLSRVINNENFASVAYSIEGMGK
ncbi:MAG: rod shape-determining protein [Lachnospiraceae bacterium]|jgi:rod shape-determining protein MreB|nr:rod shape-determining protein [Lachnospiraceae bacterium]